MGKHTDGWKLRAGGREADGGHCESKLDRHPAAAFSLASLFDTI